MKEKKPFGRIKDAAGWSVVLAVIGLIVLLVAAFAGGLMKLVGFHYESIWLALLYLFLAECMAWLPNGLTDFMLAALAQRKPCPKWLLKSMTFLLKFGIDCAALMICDQLMKGVSVSIAAILLYAAITNGLSIWLDQPAE